MSAPVKSETLRYLADSVTVSDLLIHEFNSWTNSKDAMLSPTTSCWCQADLTTDRVE